MIKIESDLRSSFATCNFIEEQNAFRCERVFAGKRRATYFFAYTETFPSPERVRVITEDLVSPSYFQAQDSSRWSHYLVFVAPDSIKDTAYFSDAKSHLEADRAYARKFLICESEFKSFLDTSVVPDASQSLSPDLLSTWLSILSQHGLADVAYPGHRAPIVRSVQFGTNVVTSGAATVSPDKDIDSQLDTSSRFLRELSITRLGSRKISGSFSFGTVNLIRGPNGSGKTSLLEAIEHFICGATLRSSGTFELMEASASFANRPTIQFRPITPGEAQRRDARWYGRTFSRGNHLPEGFARYNFLNADAAVDFARNEDLKDLQTALSKISLGPQVAFVWDRLEQFEQDFSSAVSPIVAAISRLNLNLHVTKVRLETLSQPSPLLAAQIRRFSMEAAGIGFSFSEPAPSIVNDEWLAQFKPLRDFANKTTAASECETISEVLAKRDQLLAELQLIDSLIHKISALSSSRSQSSREFAELNIRESLLNSALPFVRASIPELLNTLSMIESEALTAQPPPVTASELDVLAQLPGFQSFAPIRELKIIAERELDKYRQEMADAENQLSKAQSKASESESLLSQIRALGQRFAVERSDLDSCPLCHTSMRQAELLHRIGSRAAHIDESFLQEAHTRKQDISILLSQSGECDRVLARAISWRPEIQSHSTEELKRIIIDAQQNIDQLLSRKISVLTSLDNLEAAGLSREEYSTILRTLEERTIIDPIKLLDENQILAALASIATAKSNLEASCRELEQQSELATAELSQITVARSASDHQNLVATVSNELKETEDFLTSFEELPTGTKQILNETLSTRIPKIEMLAKLLGDLNIEFQSERAKGSELAVINEQRLREETDLSRLQEEHKRLESALMVIRSIRQNHSLEASMADFLGKNLMSIQRIFERLHLPKELKIASLANCNLERRGQSGSVQLNQISTGQRAALVLSIFFALNLSLKNGPPMMLIDDPVAHVDDLNTLSFLDFLADIAESGARQIFFATASDKLANLFCKKMEFLGSDFKPIDLRRPSLNDQSPLI